LALVDPSPVISFGPYQLDATERRYGALTA
jgi:hypothetical protein